MSSVCEVSVEIKSALGDFLFSSTDTPQPEKSFYTNWVRLIDRII